MSNIEYQTQSNIQIEYQTQSNIQIECPKSNIKLNPTFKSMSNIEYQTQSHIQILNVKYRISN